MLCCFFDLLTVPLLTLTVPLLALYWRGIFDRESRKLTLADLCILSAVWLAGYAVCWLTKWAIVAVATNEPVIRDVADVIRRRIGIGSGPLGDGGQPLEVSAARAIFLNAKVCWYGWLIVALLAIVRIRPLAAALASARRAGWRGVAVPLALFSMPFAWLAVVQQHSIWHAWFVARIYFTSFALLFALILVPRPSNPRMEPAPRR
jgi:hypothetical protein